MSALSARALERRLKRYVRAQPQTFFAVCAPGFERVLEAEVRALTDIAAAEVSVGAVERGGVSFTGHHDSLYYAHLHLYSATRVLWRVGSFLAQSLPMLFDKARKVPWEHYLSAVDTYTIRVSAKASRLNHQRVVAETLSQAISRALTPHGLSPQYVDKYFEPIKQDPVKQIGDGQPNNGQTNNGQTHNGHTHNGQASKTLELHMRLFQDTCTLSVNVSGDHLYKRGYRSLPHPAPLRETLAASLLQYLEVATYDTLLDPMCGSGTLPIEAALLCRHLPPGSHGDVPRRYAFEHLPAFQASKWQRLHREAVAASQPCGLRIVAGDRYADAVAMTAQHAQAAGVAEGIEVIERDARDWLAADATALNGRTLVFCNAPYGKRLQTADDTTTLQTLQQQTLEARARGHDITLAVITSPQIARQLEGFSTLQRFRNGGLTVVLLRG